MYSSTSLHGYSQPYSTCEVSLDWCRLCATSCLRRVHRAHHLEKPSVHCIYITHNRVKCVICFIKYRHMKIKTNKSLESTRVISRVYYVHVGSRKWKDKTLRPCRLNTKKSTGFHLPWVKIKSIHQTAEIHGFIIESISQNRPNSKAKVNKKLFSNNTPLPALDLYLARYAYAALDIDFLACNMTFI